MVHPAQRVMRLVADIPKVGADRLLIHAVQSPPQYFHGNAPVEPADPHTKFIGIPMEELVAAIRLLAGDDLVQNFLEEAVEADTKVLVAALRETVVRLDGQHYRLTISINNGRLMAHFLLLDKERTSKWKPALDKVSPNFLGGTKLTMGNRYGTAELELSAGQFAKVKALLLEIEQENFAPAKKD